jgi:hypothetical protein
MWLSKEKGPFLWRGPIRGRREDFFLLFILVGMAAAVSHLVTVELRFGVLDGFFAAGWHRAVVAGVDVEVVVDVAAEVLRAVEPGAGPDEDAAGEPLRTVVAMRSAGVGRVIVIAVGAHGGRSDAYGDLSMCPRRCGLGKADDESNKTERLNKSHL